MTAYDVSEIEINSIYQLDPLRSFCKSSQVKWPNTATPAYCAHLFAISLTVDYDIAEWRIGVFVVAEEIFHLTSLLLSCNTNPLHQTALSQVVDIVITA